MNQYNTGDPLLLAALAYAKRGWLLFPLTVQGKIPAIPSAHPDGDPLAGTCKGECGRDGHGFRDATTDDATIRRWWATYPGANIGLPTKANGLLVLDIDPKHGGDETLRDLQELNGTLPPTVEAITGSGGRHIYFQAPPEDDLKRGTNTLGQGIDTPNYVVLPPSIHPSGKRYVWEASSHPNEGPIAALPEWVADSLRVKPAARTPLVAVRHRQNGGRNSTLTSFAGSLRRQGRSEATIAAALLAENQTFTPPLAEREVRKIARSISRYPVADGHDRFARTDAGNGEFFAHLYGDSLRYDHTRRRWLLWREHWWEKDTTAEAYQLAKDAARRRYALAPTLFPDDLKERELEAKWAVGSESRQRIEATLTLARTEPALADPGTDWDTDPWLLGVQNGVLDLRTGTLRTGQPEDRITMRTAVAYNPQAAAPTWDRFLSDVTLGRSAIIDYLQRSWGYALTGIVSEHVLDVNYGTGRNGKDTAIETIAHILGDYATSTAPDMLLTRRQDVHPTELIDLERRRFAYTAEVKQGRSLDEAKVKRLTGGNVIRARGMRENFREFAPTHHLFLQTNHRPEINGIDRAIWARIRLIPWDAVFEGEGRDPAMKEKLWAEREGIFAWLVRGCLAWQERGLEAPDEVRAAVEEYRRDMDTLGSFLADTAVADLSATVSFQAIKEAYRAWCIAAGEEPMSDTMLGRQLQEHGFKRERGRRGHIIYRGLRLQGAPAGLTFEGFAGSPDTTEGFEGIPRTTPLKDDASPPEPANPSNPSESSNPSAPQGTEVRAAPPALRRSTGTETRSPQPKKWFCPICGMWSRESEQVIRKHLASPMHGRPDLSPREELPTT